MFENRADDSPATQDTSVRRKTDPRFGATHHLRRLDELVVLKGAGRASQEVSLDHFALFRAKLLDKTQHLISQTAPLIDKPKTSPGFRGYAVQENIMDEGADGGVRHDGNAPPDIATQRSAAKRESP